jgi:hypothetical protein
MSDKFNFYDDVQALERYLNLPVGSLRKIPIFCDKAENVEIFVDCE